MRFLLLQCVTLAYFSLFLSAEAHIWILVSVIINQLDVYYLEELSDMIILFPSVICFLTYVVLFNIIMTSSEDYIHL